MQKASSKNNYHFNPDLLPLAKELRKNLTKAEAALWKYVLCRQNMKGYKFVKQRPVLNYIVDFMSRDLMLIIEVDGMHHDDPDYLRKDQIRDKRLGQVGFTVLRFSNYEVLRRITDVAIMIGQWIDNNAEVPPPEKPENRGKKRR